MSADVCQAALAKPSPGRYSKGMNDNDLLSTAAAAREIGVCRSRANVLIQSGRLKATRIGNAWVVRRRDLDAVRDRPNGRPPKISEK